MPKEGESNIIMGIVGEGSIKDIGCKMGSRSEGF